MPLPVYRSRVIYLILVLTCISTGLHASEPGSLLELPSGQELEIQRFPGSGKSLLLWLPSERGFARAHAQHARRLAQMGYQVWLADLHDAYFVERNRSSIAKFPLDDIVAIIDAAIASSDVDVFLLSSSRGAQLSLIAAREWQLQNPGKIRLKGVFLTHAYLYQARPEVGEVASYLPIVAATNLPVYLLDAQYSTRSSRVGQLAAALGAGGSQVFTQVVPAVQGGFFARDKSELSDRDLAAKQAFANTIDRGLKLLAQVATPGTAVATHIDTRRISRTSRQESALTELENPLQAPAFSLQDYHASSYALDQHIERVVLVNFWASWCKPCVEEIPSLHRLRDRIEDPAFEIVTVNVGEERDRIANFLERVPVELPLLLDIDSKVAKAWKIYVYPSSYLVDDRGFIRYAYLGALEWDSPEIIAIIQNLLNQR